MSSFTKKILCKTSTISDGNMSFRFGEEDEVVENRREFLEKNGIEYKNHICMACNHGNTITPINRGNSVVYHYGVKTPEIYFGAKAQNEMIESEVLVTQEKDLALMLLTADCLPTSFYDPVTETIALAHFSRQTIADGLPQNTIYFLRDEFHVDPKNLLVHIGPHISKESYKFPVPLEHISPAIKPFVTKVDEFAHIDLLRAHNHQLTKAGIYKKNITASEIDTSTSSDHFSYYRNKQLNTKDARLATILMIKA